MTGSRKIRVLIVDDSAFMRKFFADLIVSCPDIEVVGRARNGLEAVTKVKALHPDVVTMDVEMPVMSGLEALEKIMEEYPVPVIMVSTLTARGADITLECLEKGAIDFVRKPSGNDPAQLDAIGMDLMGKIRLAVSCRPKTCSGDREKKTDEAYLQESSSWNPDKMGSFKLLLVAASTGGPQALSRLVPEIPADFPVPIAIVQHMPKGFTASFAKRLDRLSVIKAVEAKEGMRMCPGKVFLAPGGSHLFLKRDEEGFFCSLSDSPPVNSVKPAADYLFNSVALIPDARTVTVILTGMGKDGTAGARSLKAKGSVVLAESMESCVVYGMPKAVLEAGIADLAVPLDCMASAIRRYFYKS